MNKYTLRYDNKLLEASYRQQSIEQFHSLYLTIQVVMFVAFGMIFISNQIQGKDVFKVFLYLSLSLVSLLNLLIGRVHLKMHTHRILFFQGVAFCLLFDLSLKIPQVALNFETSTQLSFQAGIIFGILNACLILGPDFPENCIQALIILAIHSAISFSTHFATLTFFLPLCSILIIVDEQKIFFGYAEGKNQRQTNLNIGDKILNEGFKQGYFSCKIDYDLASIDLLHTNKYLQEVFCIISSTDLRSFIKRIFIMGAQKKQTLEEWLWKYSILCEELIIQQSIHMECQLFLDGENRRIKITAMPHRHCAKEISIILDDTVQHTSDCYKVSGASHYSRILQSQNRLNKQLLDKLQILKKTQSESGIKIIQKLRIRLFQQITEIFLHNLYNQMKIEVSPINRKHMIKMLHVSTTIEYKIESVFQIYLTNTIYTNRNLLIYLHIQILNFYKRLSGSQLIIQVTDINQRGTLCYKFCYSFIGKQKMVSQFSLEQFRSRTSKILKIIGFNDQIQMDSLSKLTSKQKQKQRINLSFIICNLFVFSDAQTPSTIKLISNI